LIGYKSEKPFFIYNLDEPSSPIDIPSNLSDCMLLIPYLYDKKQFLNYIKFLENYGVTPKVIICIFIETKEDLNISSRSKHINFQTLFYLKDIVLVLQEQNEISKKLMRNRLNF
jgi:hypothetical protein